MRIQTTFLTVLLLSIAGCAVNGYEKFYTPRAGITTEMIAASRESQPPATPIVERSLFTSWDAILDAYSKRGYTMIGYSFFNATRAPEADALKQGKEVDADLVLVINPQPTGSTTSNIPITTPTSSTTYSSGSATAYGTGGSATAYGSSTTATYGSQTSYVPITVNHANYGAIYFVKQRVLFGASIRDLNNDERQDLQTNKGTVIVSIINDSPAFMADFLSGDIITKFNGVTIKNSSHFAKLLTESKGKDALLSIIRNGHKIEKSLRLD